MRLLAVGLASLVALVVAEDAQTGGRWNQGQFAPYFNKAINHRRLGRTKNQINWKRIKEDREDGIHIILCKMRTGGWCTNVRDLICDRVHTGTYAPSPRADAYLKRKGIAPMCGTHRFYECDWGNFKLKECDDASQRYWKPTHDMFPEFLGTWQLARKRKSKWWGSCKAATGSSPTYEGGWNGKYNLVYDDAKCTWTKVKIPEPTTPPLQVPLSDDEYYDMYMAWNGNGDVDATFDDTDDGAGDPNDDTATIANYPSGSDDEGMLGGM